ncbi:MAG: DUF1559 domain-containing protein [Pirellulales bacterium]|nr:DUF1559 domain-containing protein [Pirellulales bacterium]
MEQSLFTISCTTCQARLAVRDASTIGAILPCPKCGSLVQIVAPQGMTAGPTPTVPESPVKAPPAPTTSRPASVPPVPAAPRAAPPRPVAPSAPVAPPPVPEATMSGVEPPPPVMPTEWTSPTEMLWRKGLVWVGGPLIGLVLLVGLVVWLWPNAAEPLPKPNNEQEDTPVEPTPEAAETPAVLREWIPDRARLVVSIRPSEMVGQSETDRLLDMVVSRWPSSLSALLKELGIGPSDVRRLMWTGDDPANWSNPAVVLIELEKGVDVETLASRGQPVEHYVRGKQCRQLAKSAWPYPVAFIGSRTLVTGPAAMLEETAGRSEPHFVSPAIERMAGLLSPESEAAVADLAVLIDLAAARQAKWPLPIEALDVWPEGEKSWKTFWTVPDGLGLTVRCGATVQTDVDFVCPDTRATDAVKGALDQFVPAARAALVEKLKTLPELVEKKVLSQETAGRYQAVLQQALATLKLTTWSVPEETLQLSTDWGPELAGTVAAALACRSEIDADRLHTAGRLDRARMQGLAGGLKRYAGAEGHYPEGAIGGGLLQPETRLSWIATLLPYLEHEDWYKEIQIGYSWDDQHNRSVTRRPLPQVINPALAERETPDGYPVTHYVGVAGVGPDAATLSTSNPRAGVFGYGRTFGPREIRDGTSNTIAVLGVQGHLGPWAAGGNPTVRALTQRPYVNGPDGFGSGQPGGMLAGMADGSVRFISEKVDPSVLESLATASGSEQTTADDLDDRPDRRKPAVKTPANDPATSPEPAPPKRPPTRPSAKLAAKLAQPIAELDYANVTLGQFVAFLEQFGAMQVRLDPAVLTQAGASANDRISVRLSKTTVGEALRTALGQRGLDFVPQGDRILIVPGLKPRN